jgi:diguanylate cyclase (GGDEF)-like protein
MAPQDPPSEDPSAAALGCLLDLSRLLRRQPDLETALRAVTDATLNLVPARQSSFYLLDEQGDILLAHARTGPSLGGTAEITFRPGEGVAGWVAASGETVLVEDATQDTRFEDLAELGTAARSLLFVPMLSGGQVIGVLGASHTDPQAFGAESEDLLVLLASAAAASIESARLERIGVIDPATGAYNRRHGERLLARLVGASRLHGHAFTAVLLEVRPAENGTDAAANDGLLKESVRRIRSAARLRDAIMRTDVHRLLFMLEETDIDGALVLAERIQRVLGEGPVRASADLQVAVHTAAGVVQVGEDESPEALFERALCALGRAVETGSGIEVDRGD